MSRFEMMAEEQAVREARDKEVQESVVLPGSLNRARGEVSVAVLDYMLGLDNIRDEVQAAYLEV